MKTRTPSCRRACRVAIVLSVSLAGTGPAWTEDPPSAPQKPLAQAVKLLEVGVEPRASLRLRCPKGQKETATASTEVRSLKGTAEPLKSTLAVNLEVEDVSPALDVRYALVVDSLTKSMGSELNERETAIFDTMLKTLKGSVRTVTVTDRGLPKDAVTRLAKGAELGPSLIDTLDDLSQFRPPPLREAAVGVGARWEVVTALPGRIQADVITVYTLKAREKDRLELDLSISHSAKPPQVLPAPPGYRVDLLASTGKGSGTLTIDLRAVLPSKGKVTVVTEETVKLTTSKKTSEVHSKSQKESTWSSAVVPATPVK